MKVTAMQEYGLRCMLQLVSHKASTPLTVREIAERERLTAVYVEKILVTLRRAGLVNSLRGVNGGYVLNRPAKTISVAQVLGALGQVDLGKDLCKRFTGTASECVHYGDCGIRPVWGILTRYIYGFLNQLTLEQLLQNEATVTENIDKLQSRSPLTLASFSAKSGVSGWTKGESVE
jgi:Rrf2 family protein